jgi:vacuolar-type H+-ATPase subunit I/STV1
VDASTTDQLVSQLKEIEQLSGKPASKEQLAACAKEAAALADHIAQQVATVPYNRGLATKLLQEIADDSDTIAAHGERSAEQATMALDSLSVAYAKNEQVGNQTELRAAINELFQQLSNPSAYNAPRFATQMQKVAKLVPRAQTNASHERPLESTKSKGASKRQD